jgi:hypothetical protein
MEENNIQANSSTTPPKRVSMLTTFDNPFDPFEDFASWFIYDSEKGYNSCGLLALVAGTSDSFTEEVNDYLIEDAIDSIIKDDFLNIYTKITKEVDD